MPQYFFHYHSPAGVECDDLGCSFASLELAYVDAYRSMVEIGAELIKRQVDPARHRIEIADGDGGMLMEVHFDEVFRPRRARPSPPAFFAEEIRQLSARMNDFRRLRQEIYDVCNSAKASLDQAHATLRRARSQC